MHSSQSEIWNCCMCSSPGFRTSSSNHPLSSRKSSLLSFFFTNMLLLYLPRQHPLGLRGRVAERALEWRGWVVVDNNITYAEHPERRLVAAPRGAAVAGHAGPLLRGEEPPDGPVERVPGGRDADEEVPPGAVDPHLLQRPAQGPQDRQLAADPEMYPSLTQSSTARSSRSPRRSSSPSSTWAPKLPRASSSDSTSS